jgi:hypothetical protein
VLAVFLDEPFEIQELYTRRVFPTGGYVYIGENGWPCGLRKEEFEEIYWRKDHSSDDGEASCVLEQKSRGRYSS